jgi:hypothetical protein
VNANGPQTALENSQSSKEGRQKREKLAPAKKKTASRAAKKAGRRYPNLVDNMRASRSSKTKARGR